jgi:hypothetical protein
MVPSARIKELFQFDVVKSDCTSIFDMQRYKLVMVREAEGTIIYLVIRYIAYKRQYSSMLS